MTDNLGHENLKVKLEIKEVKITILGAGQIFGEQDVFSEKHCSSLSLRCKSTEGELFQMSKEDFIKRFKQGTEPHKVLVAMALAKEKAVQDKIIRATGMSQNNQVSPELKKEMRATGTTGPTLKESAGLKPSQPDYYDIRQSMKKIIDQVYTGDAIKSRQISPSQQRQRTNTFENTRNISEMLNTQKSFGTTKTSIVSALGKKVTGILLNNQYESQNNLDKNQQYHLTQQPEVITSSGGQFLQVPNTEIGGDVISNGSNFRPSFKKDRPLRQVTNQIQLNSTDQCDTSTQPTNREAFFLASARLRESGQQMSDWSQNHAPYTIGVVPDLNKYKSSIDSTQPLIAARRVSFAGERNRIELQNPYAQLSNISERRQKNKSVILQEPRQPSEQCQVTLTDYQNLDLTSSTRKQAQEYTKQGFPKFAQQTWRGFDQKEFQNLLMKERSLPLNQASRNVQSLISRRRRITSYQQEDSRNHVYQGVACTFSGVGNARKNSTNTYSLNKMPLIIVK
ncbi:hypothetical protein FGO68_gene15688 [Halteria grandinella]|uniref:Cyclic nucleotide-binding domain-containing protein n=1 Tax=Halteria grandinella TaxID=5974 RepID=A0A8J8P8F8_HALGN|nr:hypothetical protein FGO68_gene15688 [Halteria grandinella]